MNKTTKNLGRLMRFSLLIGLIGGLFCLGQAVPAEAGVIFEDNFDNYNWTSTPAYGTQLTAAMPFGLTKDITKPGWVEYRYSSQANLVGESAFAITTEAKHGNSGKSFKEEMENYGNPPNSFGFWNGGGSCLYLGSADNSISGNTELYISVWVKFEDGYNINFNQPQGYSKKLFRVYYGKNADTMPGAFSAGDNGVARYSLVMINYLGNNGTMNFQIEQRPDIRVPLGVPFYASGDARSSQIVGLGLSNWMRIMLHIKENTYNPTNTPIGDATTHYDVIQCSPTVNASPIAECTTDGVQVWKYNNIGNNPLITSTNPKMYWSLKISGVNLSSGNAGTFNVVKSGAGYFVVRNNAAFYNGAYGNGVSQADVSGVSIIPADGLIELYVNDTLNASLPYNSIINPSAGAIENNKINTICVPDNYHNMADGKAAPSETAVYIDDLVISTDYVPLDYVIGTPGDVNGNGVVDILDLQACVNVFLGTETTSDYVQRAKEVAEPLDECNVLDVQAIVNVILGG